MDRGSRRRRDGSSVNPRFGIGGKGVGRIVFDDPARSQNVLTEEVMERLDAALAQAEDAVARGELRVLLLESAKAGSFIAGADIDAIAAVTDATAGADAARAGQAVFSRLAGLPAPTVAAVRGVCLGGGTELALACDWRLADDARNTRMGLPEVQLGILPAWGGTTRLPRLIGLRAALGLVLSGKPAGASKCRRIGLVDHVFPAEQFEDRCLAFAQELADGGGGKRKGRRRQGPLGRFLDGSRLGRAMVLRAARKQVLRRTRGRYPAPLKVLEVVRKSGGRSLAAGLELEAQAAGELLVSAACRNLLFLFRLRERARKAPWAEGGVAKPVRRLAVIGAGVMGGGIAQLAAFRDIPARMKDIRHEAVAGGLAHARRLFDGAVRRRKLRRREAERKMALVSGGLDWAGIRQAGVVVEAVVERLDAKRAVLAEAEAAMHPEGVLATNTSSLSVDQLAMALSRPGQFAGMHFFNPVHKMPLVEVVKGKATHPDAVETIAALAVQLGKVPVVVGDGPGFLVNRVLGACLNEAGHMLGEGMDARAVDRAWTGFGMPMGPYRLIDEVGIDIAAHAGSTLGEAFGERMAPAPALVSLAESGRLGRKGGRGFYRYRNGKKKPEFDASVYREMGLAAARSRTSDSEVVERLVLAMVNEAGRALEEGIVASAGEVDLAMVMGTGFPPFRGGLLKYADDRGTRDVLAGLEALRERFGARFGPCRTVAELGASGRGFHQAFPATA